MKRARNGRFMAERHALPLLAARVKSAPHVRAEATKRQRHRAKVLAVKAAIDRELGR